MYKTQIFSDYKKENDYFYRNNICVKNTVYKIMGRYKYESISNQLW